VIQEHIKKPLADEILFGRLVRGGHVKVGLHDGKIVFEIDSTSGETRPGEIDLSAGDLEEDLGDDDRSPEPDEPAMAE
jgi:ATP-dependent Clp protease ATP-binding subunit ClpA